MYELYVKKEGKCIGFGMNSKLMLGLARKAMILDQLFHVYIIDCISTHEAQNPQPNMFYSGKPVHGVQWFRRTIFPKG